MRPVYDGQENHYRKMLELQERLRKSEEERIKLEAKFNLLVQESRNRHQSCINQLRIRYVEFLEEQRARDERNSKLLGTLDKVDSSLALMTAKTERLNILRKQYEAYLLRVYGTQRANGSVTADSGLDSQNDREISPTPVFSKSVALMRKNSISYASPEFPVLSRKTVDVEFPDTYKTNTIQRSVADIERDLNERFAQAAAVPSFYDEIKDELKNRLYVPSYLADPPKYTSTPNKSVVEPNRFETSYNSLYRSDQPKYTSALNAEPQKLELGLQSYSAKSATSAPLRCDLDRYLSKIKQAQAEALEHNEAEHERSFEDADQEQNTSGDLLNVTLSDDLAIRSSPEDEVPAKDSRSRFRALLMRQAFAAENSSRNRPIDRTRRTAFSDKLGGDDEAEEVAIDKFRQSEIATPQREIGRPFVRPPTLSVDDAFAKLALLSEPRRSTQRKEDDVQAVKEQEAKLLAEVVGDQSDKDSDRNEDDEENGDGIEDDYDDTVDIESWMPDDAEPQVEEVHAQDDVRPRRKLESIEEVEQVDDEDDPIDQAKPDEEIEADALVPTVDESSTIKQPDDAPVMESVNDVSQENNEELVQKVNEAYDPNEQYANQQYQQPQQDDGTQQQYQDNAEYNQSYEQQQQQQQQGDEQQYQYSEDPNQQYAYDPNAQYPGYDGQQYTEAEYEEYMKQYQQYQQYGQPVDGSDQAQYDPNQVYDYSQDPQAYGEGYAQDMNQAYDYSGDQQAYPEAYATQSVELYGASEQEQETAGEQLKSSLADEATVNQKEDSEAPKDKSKESKKKKDVIKSILESDSDSFIERNLSNTESDFDFN